MNYEKDFVKDEVIVLPVEGYPEGSFKYKPTNAGQENIWLSKYMTHDEKGKPRQDFAMLNKLKLNQLTEVPYDKKLIHKLIGHEKEWKDLGIDERWRLLGQLKGGVFDKILGAINDYDKGDTATKKA